MVNRNTLLPAQCRAGRAFLGWSQAVLADASGVSRRSIAYYESGARQLTLRTRLAITAALEAAGVRFTDEGLVGSRAASTPTAPVAELHPEHELIRANGLTRRR